MDDYEEFLDYCERNLYLKRNNLYVYKINDILSM